MESRKAWRNRTPSAGEGVLALLEALRDGLGADGVGLFDDDRADPAQPASPINFWQAFEDRPCAAIDWDGWYRELRSQGRVEMGCGCGSGHQLYGYLIHGRWALLLVAPALRSPGAAAIASSVRALAARLPPAKDREKPSARGGSPPAGHEGLLWWVRKGPQ